MSGFNATYRFVRSFVYPATLGAALAWLVQAAASKFDGSAGSKPEWWTLLFGLWFVIYYSVWHWHMLDKTEQNGAPSDSYGGGELFHDIFDLLVLMSGFTVIGFATGRYMTTYPSLVYGLVLMIVILALLANRENLMTTRKTCSEKVISMLAFLAAVGFPGLGIFCQFYDCTWRAWSTDNLILVAGHYLVLGAYIRWPQVFGSQRD